MRVFKSLVFVLRIGRGLIATLSQVLSSVILRGGSLGQPAKPMTLLTWVIPQRTVHPLPHEVIDRGQKGILPDPVGAAISKWRPRLIAGQACAYSGARR